MDEIRSTEAVAAELGISTSRVRRLATEMDLGRKLGPRVWVFGPDDVAALRARSTGRSGRPRKNAAPATTDNGGT